MYFLLCGLSPVAVHRGCASLQGPAPPPGGCSGRGAPLEARLGDRAQSRVRGSALTEGGPGRPRPCLPPRPGLARSQEDSPAPLLEQLMQRSVAAVEQVTPSLPPAGDARWGGLGSLLAGWTDSAEAA